MRGENGYDVVNPARAEGSPPHARGKLWALIRDVEEVRITPACAGKTQSGDWEPEKGTDHPRMRGENC
mgnify:CR=1 FL=1